MITIAPAAFAEMKAQAVEEYPYECCGYITGTDDPESWIVHRCRNIQNELHARDPEQYPRDARTAYVFSEEDMKGLFFGASDRPEERVVGFYHSHPDHPAYFSEKDRQEALVDWIQPEPFYLVMSVMKGTVEDMKAFSWNERAQTFDELEITSHVMLSEGE